MNQIPAPLQEQLDILTMNVAKIKHCLQAGRDEQERREFITPEAVLLPYGLFLRRPYGIAEVAGIAAGCAGANPRERILGALELLAAAEEIAHPDPRADRQLGLDDGQATLDLEQEAAEIISEATNPTGKIGRVALCQSAFKLSGRRDGGGKGTEASEECFLDWVKDASDSYTRWKLFRQIENKHLPPCRAVEVAKRHLKKASHTRATMAEIWDAERGVRLAESAQCTAFVDELFSKLSEDDLMGDREEFKKLFESVRKGTKAVIHDDSAARRLLLGELEFVGFMEYLRRPKSKYVPTPPAQRDAHGKHSAKKRTTEGTYKRDLGDAGLPEHSVQNDSQRRTDNPL
ncbi:MAG: hypothetical protein DVB26_09045 [Verrucomicrobia bacterium]|nr:MAG: hypothetical protein DVB26_09045 [Verrucomicrobiota bacterium]